MKKSLLTIFLVLLVASSMVFVLAGCTRNQNPKPVYNTSTSYVANNNQGIFNVDITGKWSLIAFIDKDENSQTLEEYCKEKGVDLSSVKCTYNLKKDDSVVGKKGGKKVKGTYAFDGETLIIKIGNSEEKYTYNEVENTLKSTDKKDGIVSVLTR